MNVATEKDVPDPFDVARERVEQALREWLLPSGEDVPEPLRAAMEHALFPGGKRLRPALALLACQAMDGDEEAVLPAAVALELIHCYSLVHDDLPCMDDDQLRRGRPTCHVAHGEAMALLAGDALLTRAFEVIGEYARADLAGPFTREISRAAGVAGMVGGQAGDLLGEGQEPSIEQVQWIHERKTGALLRVCLRVGALAAGAPPEVAAAADRYGGHVGLAFQIVDDLLGRVGMEETTGKPVGKDDERGKLTYPAAVGVAEARRRVREVTEAAIAEAAHLPRPAILQSLATRLLERVA